MVPSEVVNVTLKVVPSGRNIINGTIRSGKCNIESGTIGSGTM